MEGGINGLKFIPLIPKENHKEVSIKTTEEGVQEVDFYILCGFVGRYIKTFTTLPRVLCITTQ